MGVLALALSAAGQQPAGAPAGRAPAPAGPATPAKPAAPDPDPYTYQVEGRRDPFLSLVGTGAPTQSVKRGDGPAGLTVAEVTVSGVMQGRGALVAMIHGADKKTYIVHQGDKLADGAIKTITPQGLIVLQDVTDPLSIVKQREVRKLLRSIEGAKE
jgi:Tfp pilus assembly protein PilP